MKISVVLNKKLGVSDENLWVFDESAGLSVNSHYPPIIPRDSDNASI